MRLFRSYLFAPGNNERILGKAFRVGADAVVIDLEDAVPEPEKSRARSLVTEILRRESASAGAPPAFVRINSVGSEYWRADLDAVVGPHIAGVRVPKVETVESLCRLNEAIGARERALGLKEGSTGVVATIESARGIANLELVARGPRVVGLTFGAADYVADVGADPGEESATLFARSALVAASRSARRAPPVASAYTLLDDDDGLRVDTQRQKSLGFFGRSAVHPRQIPIIHDVFDPTPAEVDRAVKELAAHEAAAREGRGASRADGRFVDLAVVRRARATLEIHEAAARNAPRKG